MSAGSSMRGTATFIRHVTHNGKGEELAAGLCLFRLSSPLPYYLEKPDENWAPVGVGETEWVLALPGWWPVHRLDVDKSWLMMSVQFYRSNEAGLEPEEIEPGVFGFVAETVGGCSIKHAFSTLGFEMVGDPGPARPPEWVMRLDDSRAVVALPTPEIDLEALELDLTEEEAN